MVSPLLSKTVQQNTHKSRFATRTFILTILIGIATIFFTAFNVSQSSRQILLEKTLSVAHLIDEQKLSTLEAGDRDEVNPVYLDYKSRLGQIQEVNPEIQFIYLMRKSGESVVFLVDSVEEGGEDYSPPGQIYKEASPRLKDIFTTGEPFTEIEGDRWGYWLSGFAPIKDSDGKNIAVLGLDVDFFSAFMLPVFGYSVFVTLVFIMILSMMYLNRRVLKDQAQALAEKNAILHITSHEVRTPLTEIRWACELLLEDSTQKLTPEVMKTIKQTYMSSVQMIARINVLNKTLELDVKTNEDLNLVQLGPIYAALISQYALFAQLQKVKFVSQNTSLDTIEVTGNEEWLKTIGEIIFLNVLFYADAGSIIQTAMKKQKDTVIIQVEGEGVVLPQEDVSHVFDGMHSGEALTEHTEATGLGLYLVRELVLKMKGTIQVKASGKKTTFILRLPSA